MTEPLLPLARLLLPLGRKVTQQAQKLRRERSAGLHPQLAESQVLGLSRYFEPTLSRISNGKVENLWWSNLLDRIGHDYVAPHFLRRDEVQEWLSDSQVQDDFKNLAAASLLETAEPPEIRQRLKERYSVITREAEYLADEPIEVIRIILLAGYFAGFGSNEPIASLIVADGQQTRASIEQVQEEIKGIAGKLEVAIRDQGFVEFITQRAADDLARIRQKRALAPAQAREEVRQLVNRVLHGDLQHSRPSTQYDIFHWAARLYATQIETLDEAKRYRSQLLRLSPTADTIIIDALIMESDGERDGALRMLRDSEDPDRRTTFLLILYRAHGISAALEWFEGQEKRNDPSLLTGVGWFNVAVMLAEVGRWEDAAVLLAAVQECQDEWPDLAFLEGVVNAALLLSPDLRRFALEANVFHAVMHTFEGPEADLRRKRAISCFKRAEELMKNVYQGRSAVARQWLLWLNLTHPDAEVSNAAREEVRAGLKEPRSALSFFLIASEFDIPFDAEQLWKLIDQRAQAGGLEDQDIFAQFKLAKITMEPGKLIDFLRQEEARFRAVVSDGGFERAMIEAFVADEQVTKARQLFEEHKEGFDEYDRRRIGAMLETYEGGDPCEQLERLYAQTNELFDLHNLVRYLFRVRDWSSLLPSLEELFRRERTLQNALRLVDCMYRVPDVNEVSILRFLEANGDLVQREQELRAAKVRALLHVGRFDEARALNDQLLSERSDPADLQLDINISLQSGSWERFSGIVEREWVRREEHAPKVLIQIASLAAESDATASRAVELVKLAVRKGSNDPHVLTAAIGLMYRLGREGGEMREWLSQALSLSSDEGPIKAVDLRTLVDEWMPAHQERRRAIEEHWLNGAIPLHIAAAELNVPIPSLLIGLPRRSMLAQDGRSRVVIPIISGSRQPVEIQPEWTVGLDITSLMILSHIGLLRRAVGALRKAMLAPETFILLLNERSRVRFHQPSQIKVAEEVLEMIERGHLRSAESLPLPPRWLIDEVGIHLAQLLEAAKQNEGRVIRPQPIHKLRSLMDEQAQLGEYEELVLSTVEFGEHLARSGYVSQQEYEKASSYLRSQDQGRGEGVDVSLAANLFYLDDLAITYLQGSGLLPVIGRHGLDLRIHPDLRQEQVELIARSREGEKLATAIEEVRVELRDALQAGEIEFLPRHSPRQEEEEFFKTAPTLGQLLLGGGACDAVCVDDRYINKGSVLSDRRGNSVPVLCVLDILRYLEAQGILTLEERLAALHKLRQSGFCFVPVEPDELTRLLHSVQWREDGTFVESPELRTIRQTLAKIRSLGMLQAGEEAFLGKIQYASVLVIRQLWAEESFPIEQAVYLTDWVWHHVAPAPISWLTRSEVARASEAFAHHLSLLLQLNWMAEERQEAFLEWAETRVLQPLVPSKPNIIDRLAVLVGQQLEEWSRNLAEEDKDGSSS